MSATYRNRIIKLADELGVSRHTAYLIHDYADDFDDFEAMIREYAETGDFYIIG